MHELKMEKLQAMKEYKKNQFLHKLFIYFFTFLAFSLFCSSPHWIPSLISAMKVFYLVHLPYMRALVFNPKFLFIVCNIIVVFLVGESKLMSLKSSSPPCADIYEEFVSRSGSLRRVPSQAQKKEKELKLESFVVEGNHEKRVVGGDEEKEEGEQEYSDDQEEEVGLPAEELHKRAEDLIARVNKRRRMEAALY